MKRITFEMTWQEMQEKIEDNSISFQELTIWNIVNLFNANKYYNTKYSMTLTDYQDDRIKLSFVKK